MGRPKVLDTHTLLWALTDPSKLGRRARKTIEDRRTVLLVSAVSAWEISAKHRVRRLPQADVLIGAFPRHLDTLGVGRLTITEEHCLLSGSLVWSHRDPFDRMLAAQAMIESLTLITDDDAFKTIRGIRTLW